MQVFELLKNCLYEILFTFSGDKFYVLTYLYKDYKTYTTSLLSVLPLLLTNIHK